MSSVNTTMRALAIGLPMALLVGCGSASDATSTAGEGKSKVVSGENAGSSPTSAAADPVVLKFAESGFTQFPKTEFSAPASSYAAVISNAGKDIATYVQVQVGLEDAAGNIVDSEDHTLTAVLPGTSVAITGEAFDAVGVTKMSARFSRGRQRSSRGRLATSRSPWSRRSPLSSAG